MRPIKVFREAIFQLDKENYNELTSRYIKGSCTSHDEKLYIFLDFKNNKVVAIDNSTGNFYKEEFQFIADAYIWLLGLKSSAMLQQSEKTDYCW